MSFPFRQDRIPEHRGALPDAADLVVIGGGVLGVTTAIYARRKGLSVVLLEKGCVGAEQSGRNWGWIRVQGRDYAEIPIAMEAQKLWQGLDADCDGALGLRQVGVTYIARSEGELANHKNWLDAAKPYGVSTYLLDRPALETLLGDVPAAWIGGLHTPTDMVGEPWVAVPTLGRLAAAEGVTVLEHHAARALEMAGGRVVGLHTETGTIKTGQVVLTGGAWSSLFLRRHGVSIPQLAVRSSVMATGPLPQRVSTAAADDNVAIRPRADGGYSLAPAAFSELYLGPDAFRKLPKFLRTAFWAGRDVRFRLGPPRDYPDGWRTPRTWRASEETPFERMRILDPPPCVPKLAEVRRRIGQIFPDLGPVSKKDAWAGMIDVVPDLVPIVDHVPALPGLLVGTGMSGHGFGIGPAYGRILADLAAGDDPGHDLKRFRFGRFTDGSAPELGPHL